MLGTRAILFLKCSRADFERDTVIVRELVQKNEGI